MRAAWHDFSKALWSVGGKEHTMKGFVRRARGAHAIRTPHLRSRDGSHLLYPIDAHSLYRFTDVRIQGAGTSLYQNGVAVYAGFSGARLRMVSLPAQSGLQDSLFIAGGGPLKKMDGAGSITNWGLVEPSGPASLAETSAGAGVLVNGTYRYKIIFRNTTTGARSNSHLVESSVTIASGPSAVALTSIPVSTDPQITTREIYRTQQDGQIYFLAATINDNTSTSYTDNIADADLDSTQLQTDNDPPTAQYREAWAHEGQMWWCGDPTSGAEGRAYYSPVGRPEAVKGFVDVTNTDDPCQVGFTFAESNWVMTQKNLYRIVGDDEPYIARKVFQIPGTIHPKTLVVTPFGVVYQSFDGVRRFDGNSSELIGFEQLGPIFRGQTLENLSPFVGQVATYAKEEYLISDGVQTLAFNLRLGTWRDLGLGCTGLFAEEDTENVLASFNFGVYTLEEYNTTTDGNDAIEIEWELGATLSDISQRTTVQRVFIDIDTRGQLITPTLILDNTTIELPTFLTATREVVEFSIGHTCRLVGIRLSGSVSAVVELFGLEMDLYVPGGEPSQGRG